MPYLTFVSRDQTFYLYKGIGTEGQLLRETSQQDRLIDFCPGQQPILWLASRRANSEQGAIRRLLLPDLAGEEMSWPGGRVGAIACAPDGEQALVLELPEHPAARPRLWWWATQAWQVVEATLTPDISSKLAWLDGTRVVFESTDRALAVLDLSNGNVEVGPSGCCPVAAAAAHEWYALSGGAVSRFSFDPALRRLPTLSEGLQFGRVSALRVTSDGQVFTWVEARFHYRLRGFIQQRGQRQTHFPLIEHGLGAVLGPYTL
jgi:hypothetical protein